MSDYAVWIEAEEWEPGECDPANDNTEVIVTFADESRWSATFFTYANVLSLVERYRESGECFSGKYFWARDMILVDEISRPKIEEVIARLLTTGEFYEVFGTDDGNDTC
ncbi:MAG TPA: hypothetical protein VFD58_33075 [Blastocatellia bacterium]|nr:hypothetical protein [Blastocatellia bacterium]